MPQFVAIDPAVEVNSRTVASIVDAVDIGKEARLNILLKRGIDPYKDTWYSQQKYLDAFKEIYDEIGERTLFMIGKAIPEFAEFPPDIDSLEKGLRVLDQAYHMNHRGGPIGHYRLTEFYEEENYAVMVCENPYPSEFDRGLLTAMLRKFRPANSIKADVIRDLKKESRVDGADTCTYILKW